MKLEKSKAKKLAAEFKTFAVKGNVIDLAVGVIIGGAFSKIVSSLVADIAMPVIGMLTGGDDFSKWTIALPRFFGQATANNFNIGNFIQTIVEFLILAIVVFVFVKMTNRLKKKQEETPPATPKPSKEELLLAEIRDLLKAQNEKKDK